MLKKIPAEMKKINIPYKLILLFALFLICTSLIGCTTLKSVERKYNRISFGNGINSKEAKIIAQKEYLQSAVNDGYKVGSAKVYNSDDVLALDPKKINFVLHANVYENDQKRLKYNNSWYVSFSPKFLNLFSNYYLVVLDKDTGIVQYEHDSNMADILGAITFSYIKPKLISSILIGEYYQENKKLPDNIDQLKNYLDITKKENFYSTIVLDDYKIEKLTENRVKVMYVSEGLIKAMDTALSEFSKNMNSKNEYELEVSLGGEKTVLQIYGDMDMKFGLTDLKTLIINSQIKSDNDNEIVEEVLNSVFEK